MEKNKIIILMTISLILIIFGSGLNMKVIMANNGKMPLPWDSYRIQGDYVLYNNKSQIEYSYLGDNIKLFNLIAFSIGDLFILSGIGLIIITIGTELKTTKKKDDKKNKTLSCM